MSTKAIVNVITGDYPGYKAGQERLVRTVKKLYEPSDCSLAIYQDPLPSWWKTHRECPYGFKLYALDESWRRYDYLLWLDASMYAISDMSLLWQRIEEWSVVVQESGHFVGNWATDESLKWFGITRNEAMQIRMVSGGFVGFATKSLAARVLIAEWISSMPTFSGPKESHRHDQTALSIIVWKMNLPIVRGGELMQYREAKLRGDPGYDVCVEAAGM